MEPKHSKKMKTTDKILIFIAILVIIFTAIMIWLYKTTLGIPDTLVTCFFMAVTGEFGILGYIKTTKEKVTARRWQLEDEARQRKYYKEDMQK